MSEFEQKSNNFKAITYLIIIAGAIGFVWWCYSGADCIRTLDGAVHCECDYPTSADYQKFKEDTHGTWEAVAVDGACGK